jgi:hypothetical protein
VGKLIGDDNCSSQNLIKLNNYFKGLSILGYKQSDVRVRHGDTHL